MSKKDRNRCHFVGKLFNIVSRSPRATSANLSVSQGKDQHTGKPKYLNVKISAIGEKMAQELLGYNEKDTVEIEASYNINFYKGNYYHNFLVWKINYAGISDVVAQAPEPAPEPVKPEYDDLNDMDDEDLPF